MNKIFSRLMLDEMTKNEWVTSRGRRIKVRKMDKEHLSNTVSWLRRNNMALRVRLLRENLNASKAWKLEVLTNNVDNFLSEHVRPYNAMLLELARRHE